ncbi:MAG: iron ABC transporter permease [Rhodobacteraceae bacterium]|nr:iron ABC transporter permease [Paracoccaceae bacterium]
MIRYQKISFVVLMVGILAVIFIPIISILFIAIGWIKIGVGTDSSAMIDLVTSSTFTRYGYNTFVLVLVVAVISTVLGVLSAWLVTMFSFPLRSLVEYSLFFPLAIPAYVAAYALVDFLEFAGPVQTTIRHIFGYSLASEYYFPEIRSLGGAAITLSLVLFPYIYLFTRAALREQSSTYEEIASTLGKGPIFRFYGVLLPLIRPGIFAGLIIVVMETIADFGVVDYFSIQTITAGIFSVWLDGNDLKGSAQLALGLVFFIFIIVLSEKYLSGQAGFYSHQRKPIKSLRRPLGRISRYLASIFCILLVAMGFVLPIGIILYHALGNFNEWLRKDLYLAFLNSAFTGGTTAIITSLMAIVLVYGQSSIKSSLFKLLMPLTTLGYAIPGAVIGLGILIFLISIDHTVADLIKALFNFEPGLILTGTSFGVILAYCIRFYAISHNIITTASSRVSPSLHLVPRSLGHSPTQAFVKVQLPIIKGSILTGCLLVFVDSIKELPATLLLRPFDYNTLATSVYERASLENLGQASPAALLIVLTGCCGVLIIVMEMSIYSKSDYS